MEDESQVLCSFCSSKEDSKESSFSGAGRSDSLFCAAALLAKVKTCAVMLPQLRTTARINKTNEFGLGDVNCGLSSHLQKWSRLLTIGLRWII